MTIGTGNPKDEQQPPYKAILIGGPNDGETFGLFETKSLIFAVERSSLNIARPDIKSPEFGRKPKVSAYVFKTPIDPATVRNSIVRTYFFDEVVQDPYDD